MLILIECIAKDEKLRKGFRLALEEQAKEIFNKLDKLHKKALNLRCPMF